MKKKKEKETDDCPNLYKVLYTKKEGNIPDCQVYIVEPNEMYPPSICRVMADNNPNIVFYYKDYLILRPISYFLLFDSVEFTKTLYDIDSVPDLRISNKEMEMALGRIK